METIAESQALNTSFSQEFCQKAWIGGSINVEQNNDVVTGIFYITISLKQILVI